MTWDREELARLLNARLADDILPKGQRLSIARFEDPRLRYELWIMEDSVFLSAEPDAPAQGLPALELSLPVTAIKPFARWGMPTGIGIVSESGDSAVIRLSITRREDGFVSISGSWC